MTIALDAFSSCRWLSVRNDAATPVPPHGVMEITGIDSDEQCFIVTRPTAASLLNVLVNGPQAIPAGGYGQGTRSEPVQVLFETTDGTPTLDEDWGTSNGSWKLAKDQTGFRHIGATAGNVAWFTFLGPGSGTGAVTGDYATLTQVGIVSTDGDGPDPQQFSGVKEFHDLVVMADTATTGETYLTFRLGANETCVVGAIALFDGVKQVSLSAGRDSPGPVTTLLVDSAGSVTRPGGIIAFGVVGANAFPDLYLFHGSDNFTAASGTDGLGNVFVSGILRTLGSSSIGTSEIGDSSVTMAKLADLAGLSVIGRAANTTGDPAAITASTQYNVLRYDGTQIGWGQVNIASANAVTGTLPIGNGGTGQSSNTKGDLLVGTGTIWSKRGVSGNNGWVLTEDSTETDGVKFAAPAVPSAGVGWTDPISLDFSNFSTGATTNLINTGYTLPAGGVLLGAVLKTTEAFGGGSITSYDLDLVVSGNNFISAYDGFAAVSGTNFAWEGSDGPYAGPVDFGSTTAIQIRATASHDLDTATAGAVTVYLLVSTLP